LSIVLTSKGATTNGGKDTRRKTNSKNQTPKTSGKREQGEENEGTSPAAAPRIANDVGKGPTHREKKIQRPKKKRAIN